MALPATRARPRRGIPSASTDKQKTSNGTFIFAEGIGKPKGIKGNGTFSCKSAGDAASCDVEGEYELAN